VSLLGSSRARCRQSAVPTAKQPGWTPPGDRYWAQSRGLKLGSRRRGRLNFGYRPTCETVSPCRGRGLKKKECWVGGLSSDRRDLILTRIAELSPYLTGRGARRPAGRTPSRARAAAVPQHGGGHRVGESGSIAVTGRVEDRPGQDKHTVPCQAQARLGRVILAVGDGARVAKR